MAGGGGARLNAMMESDNLYHIGISSKEYEKFKDVKFVVVGGTGKRMKEFGDFLVEEKVGKEVENFTCKETDRFCIYKVGPVLSINHGMGVPSISIMLHEVLKLLHYAKAENFIILRMGTCGGLGVEPGTVVVSNKIYNAHLEEKHNVVILGKVVARDTSLDQQLAAEIAACSSDFPIRQGATMCTDGFFEGQARRDGFVCEISEEEQKAYLRRVSEAGITNIEMESAALASLCHMTGIKCAVVCVVLLDRLKGDRVDRIPDEFKKRAQMLVANFIKSKL